MMVSQRTFFKREINLLLQISNTIDINTKSKVLKTLENDTVSRLIVKKAGSKST